MTVNLSPTPYQRFVDSNGAALAGGLLYTYVAGTTTPQATYTDSTGGTPNTNPIVLNTRGEASIWLDPTLTYKFVLQTSGGAAVWTQDYISPYVGVNYFQNAEVQVASATTTDIGAAASAFIQITGTTTITSFGVNYKGPKYIRFAGALTLTNSSTLILPGGTNITTAAGDTCVVIPKATSGTADGWVVFSYQLASSNGFGQAYQNVTGSRAAATTYTNSTGRSIQVIVVISANPGAGPALAINGVSVSSFSNPAASALTGNLVAIVPPGATYSISLGSGGTITSWYELR